MQLIALLLYSIYIPFLLSTVVPDDDGIRGHVNDEGPSRSRTPPSPPVHAGSSQSPPPSARPMRQRSMAQLRPVSIPDFDVHGALLDDKVQTNYNTLHFAQS